MDNFKYLSRIACVPIFVLASLCSQAMEGVLHKDGKVIIPLSAIKGDEQPIRLRGGNPMHRLNVPVPERFQIEKAELTLDYSNSISLKPGSQLNVIFDDRSVAQLPLKSNNPNSRAKIPLPTRDLESGYYPLIFEGAQQYSSGCDNAASGKLWSDVNVDASAITFHGELKKLDPVLSDLPNLMDKRLWSYYQLSIAAPISVSQQALFESGALVTQGVAMLMEYAPMGANNVSLPTISGSARDKQAKNTVLSGVDFKNMPDGDLVILGTRSSLTPYLRQDEINRISDSYYAIYARPDDEKHFVFLIAGETEHDLINGAKAFAMGELVFPYAERAILDTLELPTIYTEQARGTLLPEQDRKHSLREFGFSSTTLTGMGGKSTEITFWAHPDPFAPLKDTVDLELNVAYSAGMNPDSVLNLMLNDRYESSLTLSSEEGGRFDQTKISIPYTHLKPGWNTLRFIADAKPNFMGGNCQPIIDSHLQVTIFDSSTIKLNSRSDVDMLADLDLLQRTGLPLVYEPDGSGLRVLLSSIAPGTMSASWTLLAKLAQLNKHALSAATYSLNPTDLTLKDGKSTLLVGIDSSLPTAVTEHAHFPSLNKSSQASLVAEEPVLQAGFANGLSGLLPEAWQNWFGITQKMTLQKVYARSQLRADFTRESAMLLMRDPIQKQQNIILVTSADSNKLARDVNALVQFKPWGRISGDTVLWSADSPRDGLVRSARIGKPIDEDSIGMQRSIGYYFTQNPWTFVLILVGILALTALVTHYILARRQLQRELEPKD